MKKLLFFLWAACTVCMALMTPKTVMKAPIYELTTQGAGKQVGCIEVKQLHDGISIHIVASGLAPGSYGFHMHENNSLANTTDARGNLIVGGGLGGHWDPDYTNRHAGPQGNGHRGDLEMLTVPQNGKIDQTITTTRIPYKAVKGKSFVIHAMPDNYTDTPVNGGSGARAYAAIF